MKWIAVIPAYNEAPHIAAVVSAVQAQGVPLVVIDDCSTDGTGDRAREAGAEVVRHPVNGGKGKAIGTGFDYACEHGYDGVIFLDADGQHDPEEMPLFIEAARDDRVDIVLGNRMGDTAGMPFLNLATNVVLSGLVSVVAGAKIHDSQVGYRLIKTRVWGTFPMKGTRFDFESEFLIRACRMGCRLKEVPIKTIYGDEVSKINPWAETFRFIRLLLGAVMLPTSPRPRRR